MSPKEEWTKGVTEAESAAMGDFRVMAMLFRAKYIGAVIQKHEAPALDKGLRRKAVGLIGSDGAETWVESDYAVRWVPGEPEPLIDVEKAWAGHTNIAPILSAGQIEQIESECLEDYRNIKSNHISTVGFVNSRIAA